MAPSVSEVMDPLVTNGCYENHSITTAQRLNGMTGVLGQSSDSDTLKVYGSDNIILFAQCAAMLSTNGFLNIITVRILELLEID